MAETSEKKYQKNAGNTKKIEKMIMIKDDIYTITQIRDHLWVIDELGKVFLYVIEGSHQILLIDTGYGFLDLKEILGKISHGKEILVVNTHAHLDHNMGNNQFETVFVSWLDEPSSHDEMTADEKQLLLVNYLPDLLERRLDFRNWNPGPAPDVRVLHEGDIFDIGGYILEVIETPGHTPGSICLFERNNGWLFSGDTFLTWETWMYLGKRTGVDLFSTSTVLSVFQHSVEKLLGYSGKISHIFTSHGEEEKKADGYSRYELPVNVIDIYREGLLNILKGNSVSEDYYFGKAVMKRTLFEIGGVIYDPLRLGI